MHYSALQCSAATFYSVSVSEPIPVRFGKRSLRFWYFFSEPIPVRFGIFGMDFLITFPNRFQFGSETIFEIVIAFSEPNSIEQKLWHFNPKNFWSVQCMLRFRIWPNIKISTNPTVCWPYGGGIHQGPVTWNMHRLWLVFGHSCYCLETRGILTNSVLKGNFSY